MQKNQRLIPKNISRLLNILISDLLIIMLTATLTPSITRSEELSRVTKLSFPKIKVIDVKPTPKKAKNVKKPKFVAPKTETKETKVVIEKPRKKRQRRIVKPSPKNQQQQAKPVAIKNPTYNKPKKMQPEKVIENDNQPPPQPDLEQTPEAEPTKTQPIQTKEVKEIKPGELTVKFKEDATQEQINEALRNLYGSIIKTVDARTYIIKIGDGLTVEDKVAQYKGQSIVESAEANYTTKIVPIEQPKELKPKKPKKPKIEPEPKNNFVKPEKNQLTPSPKKQEAIKVNPENSLEKIKFSKEDKELKKLRGANKEVYERSDGTRYTRMYSSDVYYESDDGSFLEINDNLFENPDTGDFENISGENKVVFAPDTKHSPLVTYKSNGLSYTLTPANPEKNKNKPIIEENRIIYQNVYPQTDLRFHFFADSIKTEFILNKYTERNKFKYYIKLDKKLDIKEAEKDQWAIYDNSDKILSYIQAPYVYDSSEMQNISSDAVSLAVDREDNGLYSITLTVDKLWLQSSELKYPVYVDPTSPSTRISFRNTYVSEEHPSSVLYKNYEPNHGGYVLKVGKWNNKRNWAFFKFDHSFDTYNNDVLGVYFGAYVIDALRTSSLPVWLSKITSSWLESTANWYKQPSKINLINRTAWAAKGGWLSFDITDIFMDWQNGGNHGLMLYTPSNLSSNYFKWVLSRRSGYTWDRPYMDIYYNVRPKTSLSVSGNSNHSRTLQWNFTDPDNAHSNTFLQISKDDPSFNNNLWFSNYLNNNNKSYLFDKKPGGTYYARVKVYADNNGESDWSNVVSFSITKPVTSFSGATSVAATNLVNDVYYYGTNTPTFKWTYNSSNAEGAFNKSYIQIATDSGFKNQVYGKKLTSLEYILNLPLEEGKYYFRVMVFDGVEWSEYATANFEIYTSFLNNTHAEVADKLPANTTVTIPVSVENHGKKILRTTGADKIYIAARLEDSAGNITTIGTIDLPYELPPNQIVYVDLPVNASLTTGNYKLIIEPKTDAFWFSEKGSKPFEKNITIQDTYAYSMNGRAPPALNKGQNYSLDLSLTNLSTASWMSLNPNLTVSWYHDDQLVSLPKNHPILSDILPNTSANITINLLSPTKSGIYKVVIDTKVNDEAGLLYGNQPLIFYTSVGTLGKKDYSFAGPVNIINGNLVISSTDATFSGLGPNSFVSRTYNSQSSIAGLFGNGWHSNLESKLDPEGQNIRYIASDASEYMFYATDASLTNYKAEDGLYLWLTKTANGYEVADKAKNIYVFDSNGKPLSVSDIYGNKKTFNYEGDKITSIDEASNQDNRRINIQYYNDLNRVKSIDYVIPGRALTTPAMKYVYDVDGNLEKTIFDSNDSSLGYTNGLNIATTYKYLNGRLTDVVNNASETLRFEYDQLGRVNKIIDPRSIANETIETVYTYDSDNKAVTITSADSLTLIKLNKKLKTDSTKRNALPETKYFYNPQGLLLAKDDSRIVDVSEFDNNEDGAPNGNLTKSFVIEKSNGFYSVTKTKYDGFWPVKDIDEEGNIDGVVYDEKGNIVNEISPDGQATVNKFALNGNLLTTTDGIYSVANLAAPVNKLVIPNPWQQDIKIKENKDYTASIYIQTTGEKLSSENTGARFIVEALDANGVLLKSEQTGYFATNGKWLRLSLHLKTPKTAKTVRLKIGQNNFIGAIKIDKLQFEQTSTLVDYNLVFNPGAEIIENNLAKYWTMLPAQLENDLTKVFSGDHSFILSSTTPQVSTTVDYGIEAGKTYDLSSWIKTDNDQVSNGGAGMKIEWLDSDGAVVKTDVSPSYQTKASKLFEDDFSVDSGWEYVKETWGVNNDVLAQTNIHDDITYVQSGSTQWSDYLLEADVKVESDNEELHVFTRIQPGTKAHYEAVIRGRDKNDIALYKTSDATGGHIKLGQASLGFELAQNKYYKIAIEAYKDKIKVYIDGKLKLTISDDSYTKGAIGFGTWSTLATIDNVKVTKYTNWQAIALTSTAPTNAAKAKITLLQQGLSGNAWFDSVRLIESKTTKNEYGSNGNFLTKIIDQSNLVTENTYDNLGRTLSQSVYKEGSQDVRTTSRNYDKASRLLSEEDALGNVETYTYNLAGRVQMVTDPELNVTEYKYLPGGLTDEVKDSNGIVKKYIYDNRNRVVKEINDFTGLKQTTEKVYDINSNVVKVIDPEGFTTDYKYNEFGELKTETDANANTTNYYYDNFGRRVKTVNALGETSYSVYDSTGQLIGAVGPKNKKIGRNILTDAKVSSFGVADDTHVGAWSFNEGTGQTTVNAVNNNGDTISSATWVDGKFGKALSFSGSNGNRVETTVDIPEYNFTIELWVKTTEANTGVFSVLKGDFGTVGHDRHFYIKDGYASHRVWQGGRWSTSKKINDGKWHHWVLTVKSGEGQKAYIDGQLVGTNPYDHSDFNSHDKIWIGYSPDSSNSSFKGQIDEVRIYKRALTPKEIKIRYQTDNSSLLSTEHKFNDTVSNTATVLSGVGSWLKIDTDTNYPIGQIRLHANSAEAATLSVKVTSDGKNWKELGQSQIASTPSWYDFVFDPIAISSIKIKVEQATKLVNLYIVQALVGTDTIISKYDKLGKVVSATDALGNSSYTYYSENGKVGSTKSANGNFTFYKYDKNDNLVAVSDSLGNQSFTEYNEFGNAIKTIDSIENKTQAFYDDNNQLIKSINAINHKTEFQYNKNGQLTKNTSYYRLNDVGDWYNPSWNERSAVTIDNTTNTELLTDFQVKITVPYDSDMKTDFSDLRFTDSDKVTELSYWVEEYTSSNQAIVWVKVPLIEAASVKTIYFYYDNHDAASASNGKATFDFFDDFDTFDNTVWGAKGSYSVSGSKLTIDTGSVYSINPVTGSSLNKIFEGSLKWLTTTGVNSGISQSSGDSVNYGNSDSKTGIEQLSSWSEGSTWVGANIADGTSPNFNIATSNNTFYFTQGTEHIVGQSISSSAITTFKDYNQTGSWNSTYNQPQHAILGYYYGNRNTTWIPDIKDIEIDWYRVRKYSANKPAVSISGSNESRFTKVSSVNKYDNLGRLKTQTDPLNKYISFNYDSLGRVSSSWSKNANEKNPKHLKGSTWKPTTRTYYDDNKLDVEINPLGVESKNYYDNNGSLTSLVSDFGKLNRKSTFYYDKLDRLTAVVDPRAYANQSNAWYSALWSKRTPITVDNTANTETLTDFQTKITVPYDSDMKPDFSDLRFTDSDKVTELSYWVEEYTSSTSATVWLKVPTIAANSTKTIYMYYGNSDAASASNGKATFEFFDDFDTFDNTIWQANGIYSVSGSKLTIDTGSVYSINPVTGSSLNKVFEGKAKWVNTNGRYSGLSQSDTDWVGGGNWGSNAMILQMTEWWDGATDVSVWAGDGTVASYNIMGGAPAFNYTQNQGYIIGQSISSSAITTFKDYNQTGSWAGTFDKPQYAILGGFMGSAWATDIKDIEIDWYRVRKHTSSEPVTSLENEEIYPKNQNNDWYNINWLKRAPITIDNTANTEILTDFQTKVTVPYDTDMKPDFSDLRFTDSDKITDLSYWVEEYTSSTSATVWLKVPTIAANSTKTIYMYYGNTDAVSTSNGYKTFAIQGVSAFWQLDEGSGSTTVDVSGSGNTGTLTNGPSWTTGKFGNALSFDGVDDYVESTGNINNSQSFSVEAWVKTDTLSMPQWERVIVSDRATGSSGGWDLYQDQAGRFGFGVWQPGYLTGQFVYTPSISANTWYHVAGVYNSSNNTINIYLNGVGAAPVAVNGSVAASSGTTRIGMNMVGYTAAGNRYFDGLIDEVKIYNRVRKYTPYEPTVSIGNYLEPWFDNAWSKRAPIEINNNANSSNLNDYQVKVQIPYDSDMKADFSDLRFTDSDKITELSHWVESYVSSATATVWLKVPYVAATSMKTIYMYYGNPNALSGSNGFNTFEMFDVQGAMGSWNFDDGTASDQTGVNNGALYGAIVVGGKYGNSLSFDGIDDYIGVNSVNLFNGRFTVSGWFKFNTLNRGEDNAILGHGTAMPNNGLHIGERGTKAYFGFYANDLASNASLPVNSWVHLTYVYDGGQKLIYINGNLDATQASVAYQSTIANAEIGRYPWAPSANFSGAIDEFRIYNRALSSTEIQAIYTNYLQKMGGYFNVRKYALVEPTTFIGIESNIPNESSSRTWYDYRWQKRIAISINYDTGVNSLTDYQVKVTIPYNADMKTDFSDLRFTDSDKITKLNYWIESFSDSTSAIVWVKVPLLEASSSKTIYIYYGSSDAVSASNGQATFDLFDDFSGNTINTSKWQVVDTNSNIRQNNQLIISDGAASWGTTGIFSKSNFDRQPIVIQSKYKTTLTGANYQDTTMMFVKDATNDVHYTNFINAIYFYKHSTTNTYLSIYEDGISRGNVGSFNANTQYWVRQILKPTGATTQISIDNINWQTLYDSSYSMESPLKVGLTHYQGGTVYVDDFIVRKYVATEPTIVFNGTEETSFANQEQAYFQTLYKYDEHGNKVAMITAAGTTTYKYDANNRLTETIDPLGVSTYFTYDKEGNLLNATGADNKVDYVYNANNKLAKETQGSKSIIYEYDNKGRLSSTLHIEANTVIRKEKYTYDAGDRLASKESIDYTPGLVASYKFDDVIGSTVTDSAGNNNGIINGAVVTGGKYGKALSFDGVDDYVRIPNTQALNPATITVAVWAKSNTTTWNNYGFLASKRDAYVLHPRIGVKDISFYINAGGWVSLTYNVPSGFDITQWHQYVGTYDGSTIKIYIDGSLKASMLHSGPLNTADTGDLYVGWDDEIAGRYFNGLIDEVKIFNRALNADELRAEMLQSDFTVDYAYDSHDNLVQVTNALGESLYYAYTDRDELDYMYQIDSTTGEWITLASYVYDPNGNVTEQSLGNGVGSTYKYDPTDRLTSYKIVDSQGNVIEEKTYTYDNLDNLTSDGEKYYVYDAVGQLIEVGELSTINGERVATATYTYDTNGNMLTRTNKTTGEVTTYVYNAANQLTSSYKEDVILSEAKDLKQYTYNSSGATTSDGKYVYEYDAKDHLTRILNSSDLSFVASYTYDYLGRRTSKTTPEGTTRYTYNDISAVLSSESNGKELQFISDANEYGKLVSLIIDGTQYFYVYNGNDEIIGLTDSSGAFAVRYSYDSWGVPTEYDKDGNVVPLGTFQNPYMYKTYYYDFETNLYYLNARYYDPSIGRFLSRDPKLGQDDNRLGKNEYIYVENSPIQNSDPNGLRTRYNYKNYSYNYAKRRASYWHRKYKRAYKTRNKSKASWRSFVKARGTAWFWYDQVYGAKRAMKRGRSKHAGRNKSRTKAEKKRARKHGHKDVKRVDKKYKHKRGWAPKSVKRKKHKSLFSRVKRGAAVGFVAGVAFPIPVGDETVGAIAGALIELTAALLITRAAQDAAKSRTRAKSKTRTREREKQESFRHYSQASYAATRSFSGGLWPGSYATKDIYTSGEIAQQKLALRKRPNAYVNVNVPESWPKLGPFPVAPASGMPGGGTEYIFPIGTFPGSASFGGILGP